MPNLGIISKRYPYTMLCQPILMILILAGGSFSCEILDILDKFLEELQKLPEPFNSSAEMIQLFNHCDSLILQEDVRIKI